MYKQKINYVLIGFFVTTMLSAGVGAIALLAGRTGPVDRYFIVLDNVADVKFGTQVRYEGYPVGQVEDITPVVEGAGMEFRVGISIQPGWRVPSDSVARIGSSSFLAAKTIDIDRGESQVAVANSILNVEETTDNLAAISRDLIKTMVKVDNLAGNLDRLLEDNKDNVDQSLKDLQYTLSAVSATVDSVVHNLEGTTRNMNEFSRMIRQNPGLLLDGTPRKAVSPARATLEEGDVKG